MFFSKLITVVSLVFTPIVKTKKSLLTIGANITDTILM